MSRMVIQVIALVLLMAAVCEVSALSAGTVERGARSHASVAAVHEHRDEKKQDHEDVLDEEKREREVLKGLKEGQQHDLNLGHRAVVSLGAAEVWKSLATSALLRKVRKSVVLEDIEKIDEEPTAWAMFWAGCSYVLNATIAALIYRHFIWQNADDDIEALLLDQKEKEGFEYALFSGEQCNLQLAVCSLCCLCIRWPATVSDARLKLIAFWPAFFIFVCLEGFIGLLFGLLWMVQVGVCIWARQKIRAHYGLPTAGATYIEDCLAWGCCCWFAGAQEAKQMMHVKGASTTPGDAVA